MTADRRRRPRFARRLRGLLGLVVLLSLLLVPSRARPLAVAAGPVAFEVLPIPDVEAPQNGGRRRPLDFAGYIRSEGPVSALRLSLRVPPRVRDQGHAAARVVENRFLEVTPTEGWIGVERVTLEVSDGERVEYRSFEIRIVSSEAGTVREVERDAAVALEGEWVAAYHGGADYVYSDRPGDRLRFSFRGVTAAVRVFAGPMHDMQRYYEGEDADGRYHFLADWKTYPPARFVVWVDDRRHAEVDLAEPETPGWTELLLVDGLAAGDHEIVVEVSAGTVAIDRVRLSQQSLAPLTVRVTDPQGTPLTDVVLTFSRPERPPILLRTDASGSVGTTYAVPRDRFELAVEPDANPGYFRPFDPDECLEPWSETTDLRAHERDLEITLEYSDPSCRSLGALRRPVSAAPAIVAPGDTLPLTWRSSAAPEAVHVGLRNEAHELPLASLGSRPAEGTELAHVLRVSVPSYTPAGLYDLDVTVGSTTDSARRAVRVVERIPDTIRLVHLSDTHIRSSRSNREHAWMLQQLAAEVSVLDPLFVVITGDLTDVGARPEYLRLMRTLAAFDAPTFLVPGNHDHYSWWTRYRYRGGSEYDRYVGPRFHSLALGPHTFVFVDTANYEPIHDRRRRGAHADQMSWLLDTLREARARAASAEPAGLVTVLAHYDHTSSLPEGYPITDQLESMLGAQGVGLFLHGHRHRAYERTLAGGVQALATGAALGGSYRVVEIDADGSIRAHVLQQGDVEVEWLSGRDGADVRGSAIVHNRSAQALDGLVLAFRLPYQEAGFEVRGGSLAGVDRHDDGVTATVRVTLAAAAGEPARVEVAPARD